MKLQDIETIVLGNIGHKRYEDFNINTNEDSLDLNLLHGAVFQAIEEIRININLQADLKQQTITTSANTQAYSLATDFDIPIDAYYINSDGTEYKLEQVYPENLLAKLNGVKTTESGNSPGFFMIFGNSSEIIQIKLFVTPADAGTLKIDYRPLKTVPTSAATETVYMKKFPNTIIKLTTAYGFMIFKKDKKNFAVWTASANVDLKKINHRELQAATSRKEVPDSLTRSRRKGRLSR